MFALNLILWFNAPKHKTFEMSIQSKIILSVTLDTDNKNPRFDVVKFFQDRLSESLFKGFKSTRMKFRLDKSKKEEKKIEQFYRSFGNMHTFALLVNIQDNKDNFVCGVMGLSATGVCYSFNLTFKKKEELRRKFLYQRTSDLHPRTISGDYFDLKISTLGTFINHMFNIGEGFDYN